MEYIGFFAGNIQKKCALCGRNHKNSFLFREEGHIKCFGVGCVQKLGWSNIDLVAVMTKAVVTLSRLSYQISKDSLLELREIKEMEVIKNE